MLAFIKLIILALSLFVYFNYFLTNFDDKNFVIANKIYIFVFVFAINFILSSLSLISSSSYLSTYSEEKTFKSLSINDIIQYSICNALVAVIAFDIYNDFDYGNYFNLQNQNHNQKILTLLLLIVSFFTVITVLQIILTDNCRL